MENYTAFTSSNISRISYDETSSNLEVEFLNGRVYQYFDIPVLIWQQFKQSDSKGKFLHTTIKGNYRYTRV